MLQGLYSQHLTFGLFPSINDQVHQFQVSKIILPQHSASIFPTNQVVSGVLTLFRILYLPFSYLQSDTRYHVSRYFFILYSFFISICLHSSPSPPPALGGGLYSIFIIYFTLLILFYLHLLWKLFDTLGTITLSLWIRYRVSGYQ